jgi:CheY-like chemotaxis protein
MRSHSMIGLCYFPTTTVLVDDNITFLSNIKSLLKKKLSLLSYHRPQDGLAYLNEEYVHEPFSIDLLVPENPRSDRLMINVDVRAIDQQIYNPERFAKVAVVVVDYSMPGMDGFTFCQQLKLRRNLRIIMLTGEADNRLAVQAFNEGLIHQFIMKSAPDLETVIFNAIQEQQQNYFIKESEAILECSYEQSEKLYHLLTDPHFITLFDSICQQHKIVEYYLLDSEGSFLLLDGDKRATILALKSQEVLNHYHEIAEFGENTKASVLTALKNYTHVPLFYLGRDLSTPPENWESYLHPANKLMGLHECYYYSLLENASTVGIRVDEILSYNHYMATSHTR